MKHYALIKNNEIVSEGLLPYFWQSDENDEKIDMLSKTDSELNALGWYEIIEMGRREFDPELQLETFNIVILNGLPTKTFNYQYKDDIKNIFLERNKRKCKEIQDNALFSNGLGRTIEYDLLSIEAINFLGCVDPNQIDYPLLFSTIDKTLSQADKNEIAKLEAIKILAKHDEISKIIINARSKRKSIEEKLLNENDPKIMIEIEDEWNDGKTSLLETAPAQSKFNTKRLFEPCEITWKNGIKSRNSYNIISDEFYRGVDIFKSNNYSLDKFLKYDEIIRCTQFGCDTILNTFTTYMTNLTTVEKSYIDKKLNESDIKNQAVEWFGKKIKLDTLEYYEKFAVISTVSDIPIKLPKNTQILFEVFEFLNGNMDNSKREIVFKFLNITIEQELFEITKWCKIFNCNFSVDPFYEQNNETRWYTVVFSKSNKNDILYFKQYIISDNNYTYNMLPDIIENCDNLDKIKLVEGKNKLDIIFAEYYNV